LDNVKQINENKREEGNVKESFLKIMFLFTSLITKFRTFLKFCFSKIQKWNLVKNLGEFYVNLE